MFSEGASSSGLIGCWVNWVRWGSNPILTSGQDLSPVVPYSTLPRFVNSQLVVPVGVLSHVSVKFKLFLSDY